MDKATKYMEDKMNECFEYGDKERAEMYRSAFTAMYRLDNFETNLRETSERLSKLEERDTVSTDQLKDVVGLIDKVEFNLNYQIDRIDKLNVDIRQYKPLNKQISEVVQDMGENGVVGFRSKAALESLLDKVEELENKNT